MDKGQEGTGIKHGWRACGMADQHQQSRHGDHGGVKDEHYGETDFVKA